MSDERAFDEPLPWLAAVEDEDEPRGISAQRMITALSVVLVAALIVVGTFFWLGHRNSASSGPPQLIKAPPGPYKVKPPTTGGLDINGESETAFETSAGEDKDSKLNLDQMPETAIVKPPKAVPPPPAPAADAKTPAIPQPKVRPEAKPEPKPTGPAGATVQLGAFANQAQAERAWTALSARFPGVAASTKLVVPFTGGIRLRASAASPADARQLCQTLKAAGENCFVAQ